jgi:hypothetical protein
MPHVSGSTTLSCSTAVVEYRDASSMKGKVLEKRCGYKSPATSSRYDLVARALFNSDMNKARNG